MTEEKPTYKKKLIEVALPLSQINLACAHEGMPGIRKHPRGLHKWFAQRRLASIRAVLFSQVMDDPSNYMSEKEAIKERKKLFKTIEKMCNWNSTYNEQIFSKIRSQINESLKKKIIIADCFCGGGSIPVEAQRLGFDFQASDLNPISVILTKALVEIPPIFKDRPPINPNTLSNSSRIGSSSLGLVSDIEYYGKIINEQAKVKIGHLYPKVKDKTVISWLWARQVVCPNPACGINFPLVKSFTVCKTARKRVDIIPEVDLHNKTIHYNIGKQTGSIIGSVGRKGAICLSCKTPVTFDYIRDLGNQGKISYALIGLVLESTSGREYLSPIKEHEKIALSAVPEWIPETKLPDKALGFRVQLYGMKHHSDLFSPRQLTAMSTFCNLVREIHPLIMKDAVKASLIDDKIGLEEGGTGAKAYADAICTYLGFAVDRCADTWSNISAWQSTVEAPGHTFGRHAIPMGWDFGESNPFSESRGSWKSAYQWICENVNLHGPGRGKVMQLDAASPYKSSAKLVYCTDPPYFDNIGYADLSDFFYVAGFGG